MGTMRLVVALLVLALAGSACVNHLKRGDRAAAVGDWINAEAEYRRALHKEPGNAELKEKHANARTEAIRQAKTRAERCLTEKNFECAQTEADYASSLDENDSEAHELKLRARRARAIDQLETARAKAASNPSHALDLVDFGRSLSSDDEVLDLAREVEEFAVSASVERAAGLRQQAAQGGPEGGNLLDEAIVLLARAAKADPSLTAQVEAARAEKTAWAAAEYERLARLGDDRLSAHDWPGAIARYQEAERFQEGGRAKSGIRYATLVKDGDAATAARDWKAATGKYGEARTLPDDRDRYAASQYDRVLLRPWLVEFGHVLVHPLKADGKPWVGRPSVELSQQAKRMFKNRRVDFRAVQRIPKGNHPSFHLEVTLPDGRRLRTDSRRGINVQFDASVVVESNTFENRSLPVTVVHDPPGDGEPEVMGTIEPRIRALLTGSSRLPPSGSVLRMETRARRAPGSSEGAVTGLEPIPEPEPETEPETAETAAAP